MKTNDPSTSSLKKLQQEQDVDNPPHIERLVPPDVFASVGAESLSIRLVSREAEEGIQLTRCKQNIKPAAAFY